jgi:hypothetical protein
VICDPCKQRQAHQECRGGTWCDCQHRETRTIVTARPKRLADNSGVVRPVEDVAL